MVSLTGISGHDLDLSLKISQPVHFVSVGDQSSSSSTPSGAIPFAKLESMKNNPSSSSIIGQSYHMSIAQEHHPCHVQNVPATATAPPAAFFLPNNEVRKS